MMFSFGKRQSPKGRPPQAQAPESDDTGGVLGRLERAAPALLPLEQKTAGVVHRISQAGSDLYKAGSNLIPGVALQQGLTKAKQAIDKMTGGQ